MPRAGSCAGAQQAPLALMHLELVMQRLGILLPGMPQRMLMEQLLQFATALGWLQLLEFTHLPCELLQAQAQRKRAQEVTQQVPKAQHRHKAKHKHRSNQLLRCCLIPKVQPLRIVHSPSLACSSAASAGLLLNSGDSNNHQLTALRNEPTLLPQGDPSRLSVQ